MPTASERLLDLQIGHAIHIRRFSEGLVRRIVRLLDRADADLVAKIAERLSQIEERGFDLGPATTARLEQLLEEIRALNAEVYRDAEGVLGGELEALAEAEATFQKDAIVKVLPFEAAPLAPSPEALQAIVYKRPFQGAVLKDWASGLESGRRRRLGEAIRIGLVEGETTDQIVRRVRGTRALNYSDGILEVSRRSAAGVVRTAVTHVTTQAREETFGQNDDLVKGVRWVSTLDGRTSAVCRARDGKVYEVGKGPRPPAHWACRSTTTPVLKSWKEMGLDLKEMPEGTRASMDGQVPASLTYDAWLRKQPAAFQDEVLGPTKAKLFREGLAMDRFVDRSGHEYTLDELRRRDAEVFERAGL